MRSILRAYRVELDPTVEQRRYLERAAGTARFAYNWALREWRRQYRVSPTRVEKLVARWYARAAREAIEAFRETYEAAQFAEIEEKLRDEATGSAKQLRTLYSERHPDRKAPNAYALHGQLTAVKREQFPWMREVTAFAVREAVGDVGRAYEHFFRRLKEGVTGCDVGAPRFRAHRDDISWHADQGSAIRTRCDLVRRQVPTTIDGSLPGDPQRPSTRSKEEWRSALYLGGLGWVECKPGQRLPSARFDAGAPSTDPKRKLGAWVGDAGVELCGVGFSRRAGRWFAAVRARVPAPTVAPREPREPGTVVGVELGVREMLVTSDGKRFGGLRDVARINRLIAKRRVWERRMARRWQQGKSRREQSAGWREAAREVRKYHARITDMRREIQYYVANRVIDSGAETIVMRDMQIKQMLRRDMKLTREEQRARNAIAPMVQHVGMYELRRIIEYKQEWAGGKFVAAANDYPSTRRCHECGAVRESDPPYGAPWCCQSCGERLDREENSSLNLRDYTPPASADGGADDAGTPRRKRRTASSRMASRTAQPAASERSDTSGADGSGASSAPLGSGNGTPAEAPAEAGEKRPERSGTQPGSSGEPDARLSDRKRERSGDADRRDHGSRPIPEGAPGARASRSQSGVEDLGSTEDRS